MTIKRLGMQILPLSQGYNWTYPEASPAIEPSSQAIPGDSEPLNPQQLITEATPPSPEPLPPPLDPGPAQNNAALVYLSELQPQPPDWLWQHRLAAGTLAMLSGEPGAGKTWIALAIAAALTRGRAPVTGEKLQPCTVLYVSTEHAASQIIFPRFTQLDGDPARLVVLRGDVLAPHAPSAAFHQAPLFENALQQTQARLLILDPWHGLLHPDVDLHQPAQTRPLFDHLARQAEKHNCCILLLRHLHKPVGVRPSRRAQAFIELTAALRTEFLAGSSPDAPTEPALLHLKSNLGPLAPPLAYKIDHAGNFLWKGHSNLSPEELLSTRPTGAGLPKRKFAAQWLRQFLQDGSRSQGTVETAAERDGVCIRTLRRAKFDLGVRSLKDGKQGVWCWTLPPSEEQPPDLNPAR